MKQYSVSNSMVDRKFSEKFRFDPWSGLQENSCFSCVRQNKSQLHCNNTIAHLNYRYEKNL